MELLVTLLLLVPLAAAIPVLLMKGRAPMIATLLVTVFEAVLALVLLGNFDSQAPGFQAVHDYWLIEPLGISWKVGVDGVSMAMVLLTAFLFPLVTLGSKETIKDRVAGYYASMLVLESGVLGAFVALDLFLFYVFWEIMLVPMFFIIGMWGGKNRVYATVKFVLFTMIGSLLMLVAILYVAHVGGSFDYEQLVKTRLPLPAQHWVFAAFALAFLIKIPLFPFHTWLPDAHTEAPAGGSVVLAGVLLKLGAYGLLRYCLPMFPDSSVAFAPLMMALGVIGVVHGAMAAAVQPDMKRLIAYSSVSHMGFIVLGVFSLTQGGLEGSVVQMINHAISTGALFFLVGMLYDQTHTRDIADYGGIAAKVPLFAAVFLISTLSSVGLPGLNGFVGEYAILVSSFRADPILTTVAVSGVVLGAWYLFRLYGRVFFGSLAASRASLRDINLREFAVLAPLVALMFVIGFYPQPLFDLVRGSVTSNVLDAMKLEVVGALTP